MKNIILFSALTTAVFLCWWQFEWIALELPTRMTTLASAQAFYINNSNRSDIVVSMSSIPGREHLVTLTLKCLLLQSVAPAAIYIHVPVNKVRWPQGSALDHLKPIPNLHIVHHEKDLGPALKVIPTLLSAENPDQKILYLDDDTLYPRTLLSDVGFWSQRFPDAALTTRGWNVPVSQRWIDAPAIFGADLEEPMSVDIVTGCGSVLVRPRFFDFAKLLEYDKAPREAFFVDDIWLSGNLARGNIERYIVPRVGRPITQILQMTTISLSGGVNADGRNNDVVIQYFKDAWKVNRKQPR